MKQLNIALLDDHQIIIDGLKLLLENESGINVVIESTNGHLLIEKLDHIQVQVDIIIMDLMMPIINGYEVAKILQEKYPDIKIIILTMNTKADIAYQLVEDSDIKGILPKSVSKNTLMQAILDVDAGKMCFHKDILEELKSYKVKVYEKEKLMLSPRELEIIDLVCKGFSSKEIAAKLYLSEHTVLTHRKNISKKTYTNNLASLIELTRRLNLIPKEDFNQ